MPCLNTLLYAGPYVSIIDGSLHMTKSDLDRYDSQFSDTSSDSDRDADRDPEDSSTGDLVHLSNAPPPSIAEEEGERCSLADATALPSLADVYEACSATGAATESVHTCGVEGSCESCMTEGDVMYGADLRGGMNSLFGQVQHLMKQQPAVRRSSSGGGSVVGHTALQDAEEQQIARHHSTRAAWRRGGTAPWKSSGDGARAVEEVLPQADSTMEVNQVFSDVGDEFARGDPVGDEESSTSPGRIDVTDQLDYTCPKCKRVFHGSWHSCHKHATTRQHGDRCTYDPQAQNLLLPMCLSAHALLPLDPGSGWCDLQGRRKYIEDAHAIVLADRYKFFGVFDGHWGSRAAKYASVRVQMLFDSYMRTGKRMSHGIREGDMDCILKRVTGASDMWKKAYDITDRRGEIISKAQRCGNTPQSAAVDREWMLSDAIAALHDAFVQTDLDFTSTLYPGDAGARSGSTATVAVLFDEHILIGNIGDSRAVLCCDINGKALPLTIDHTPYNEEELRRVKRMGGYVEDNGVMRVNGQLAVTRSIGDQELGEVLTSVPDVVIFRRRPTEFSIELPSDTSGGTEQSNALSDTWSICDDFLHFRLANNQSFVSSDCGGNGAAGLLRRQHFLILGSDGLWDVMGNQEVVNFVCDSLLTQLLAYSAEDDHSLEYAPTYASSDAAGAGCDYNPTKEMPSDAFDTTARQLAQEAYIRGSMDNIGVALVDLLAT